MTTTNLTVRHLDIIPTEEFAGSARGKDLLRRASGRFYTPHWMATDLAFRLDLPEFPNQTIRVVDPFCGDGRLIEAFARKIASSPDMKKRKWSFYLWDNDLDTLPSTVATLRHTIISLGLKCTIFHEVKDSFCGSREQYGSFDIVLTNPPWEALKPDQRELSKLSNSQRKSYETELKLYDRKIALHLPLSQPEKKLYGWGTNLSRCGLELSLNLLKAGGCCSIVLPSSVLADQVSAPLRRWMFGNFDLRKIDHYPAEVKAFDGVDQACVILEIARCEPENGLAPVITRYDRNRLVTGSQKTSLSSMDLDALSYRIPSELELGELSLLLKFSCFPKLSSFLTANGGDLWLGRELDETGHKSFTSDSGKIPFLKGRNIGRYRKLEDASLFLLPGSKTLPQSWGKDRIAWRDVSRRSQTRRMITTIIPGGNVTGNSLHVGYFTDESRTRLKALLGIMNSLAFEFQLRSHLGTGHVSLGSVREIRVPDLHDQEAVERIAILVTRALGGDRSAEADIEREVASLYGLSHPELMVLANHFPGLDRHFVDSLRDTRQPANTGRGKVKEQEKMHETKIPNHYTARLSELDLRTAIAVPPGGNWKNVPEDVPSNRIRSIRESYAAGGGSRSTYYGRLHPDRPSYTINTYFNRPGNGCHLHYDFAGGQHRVLSEREAARLQSFPDNFVFEGSHASIHKQIGNAVPPLLAFQIASMLGPPGQYVDLFSGAGGLSLGFKWAGWQPMVANDIEAPFLATYARNIHGETVCGDIRHEEVFKAIVKKAQASRDSSLPFFVIGGPPCQGFSTAGKRRSLADERNHLFNDFRSLIRTLKPDGFIFENVSGLVNMEKGAVFQAIKDELAIRGNRLNAWLLKAEEHGVPQRRTRLILASVPSHWPVSDPPAAITGFNKEPDLLEPLQPAVSTEAALSDLPPLSPGEDASMKPYLSPSKTPYQLLMRSQITPAEYLKSIGWNNRSPR